MRSTPVPESLGSLIDALITTSMKLWHTQDKVYQYDKMAPGVFASQPPEEVQQVIHRLSSLNLERNRLMSAIDSCLNAAVQEGSARVDARVKIT